MGEKPQGMGIHFQGIKVSSQPYPLLVNSPGIYQVFVFFLLPQITSHNYKYPYVC